MGSRKKGSISEDDVSIILRRYPATLILGLLQEISQCAGPKIDWNALVNRTSTGITNAREYQMLWRHLAYHDKLLDKVEDRSEPLDDDSDLEFELEAFPAASAEALSDATACAKILISSGSSRESGPINRPISRTNLEAPLTRNLPDNQTPNDPSDKQLMVNTAAGTIVVVPPVQKQSPVKKRSAEVPDGNGSAGPGLPDKKKRQAWTKEEDLELIAAVQKCGEGNWSNILKGDFMHNRTASQLSQRWAIIRRRQANSLAGSSNKTVNSTRSEERLAAQKAFSMALDMPMTGSLSTILSGSTQSNTPASSATLSASVSEPLPAVPLQASTQTTSQKLASNASNKPRAFPKKLVPPGKPSVGPNPLIQAAAFAAGGRIATPSTAASLFKAAQSKSAVHIRPGGGASPKSPIITAKSSPATTMVGSQPPSVRNAQPAVTVPAPAVASSVLSPTLPRHGMQQLQGSSQRSTSNPLTSCAAVPAMSAQPSSSESNPPPDSQENAESDSDIAFSVIPAIDVDELLAEEVKGADELELDGATAQNHQTELLSLDVGENDNNIVNSAACGVQKAVLGGVDISKSQTDENQTVNTKAVSSDTESAENKAREIDVGESQVPVEGGTKLASGVSSNSQSMNVVSSQNQIVSQEQLADAEAVVDEVKQSCIQVNSMQY